MGGFIFYIIMEQKEIRDIKDLTAEERLDLEEKAIEALLQLGVKFSVPLKIYPVKPPKMVLWWNRKFPKMAKIWRDKRIPLDWDVSVMEVPDADRGRMVDMYMRNFHIKPLYLGTIDYLRKLYIQIEFNEKDVQDKPIQESKKLFKYIPLMAEIAAVAVINSPEITNRQSKEVTRLKEFFMNHLTVARLKKLSDVISQMMNPGGFTSSIRSIREVGTTKPKANLVE
ncbi:MAG: hypothetical protein [Satomivirus wayo]|jgi:hypothetical protein|uniref:Uncharacterized protein n=1 Tax=Bacteriophage sp. TaxID=38018 RepID=A0ABY5T3L7_9VIRU|nr:MAG: hypothetical protein [Bacteriophage sp.]UVY14738.1 MAG: hypothetical protein [Bacteriophage sp.]UWG23483.1 MAG: hypothetical protein [Bacteriophage sp.]